MFQIHLGICVVKHFAAVYSKYARVLIIFPAGNVSFGTEVLQALGKQTFTGARAASVLAAILEDNAAVKKKLVQVVVNPVPQSAVAPTSLLLHCIAALSHYIYSPGSPPLVSRLFSRNSGFSMPKALL